MFRYAVRRILWSVPTLLATSLVLFFVTTLAPQPVAPSDPTNVEAEDAYRQARRERFLDLPSFFDVNPVDVRTRAAEDVAHVASADDRKGESARELVRLGGAALPYILPRFDVLSPDGRRRVAAALGPVAERMGMKPASVAPADGSTAAAGASDSEARSTTPGPDAEVLFWTQLWDDRALDFTRAGVDRAVTRLVEHGSDLRERDLTALDTFALGALVRAMAATADRTTLERLTRLAHHASGRGPVVDAATPPSDVARAVADWHRWWFVYSSDFVAMSGSDRIIAMLTDTRYGKWLRQIVGGQLGVSVIDGRPIAEKLRERAPVTVLICALALLFSSLVAVPVGALSAWRRGRPFDVVSSAAAFVVYATPIFAVAEILRRLVPSTASHPVRVALAVSALATGSIASIARWQRTAMLDVMGRDFVRTAHAKGLSQRRILVLHVLRNALMPAVTMMGQHLPSLFGGAFVVEEVFGLPGIGFETLRAIESHDSAWMMAVLLTTAVMITAGLVASDIAYAALDPRVRDVIGRRRGGLAS